LTIGLFLIQLSLQSLKTVYFRSRFMKKYLVLLLISLSLTSYSQVESRNYSAWNAITPVYDVSDKVTVGSQFHRRSTSFYSNINQWVIRPYIDVKVSKSAKVGLGVSYLDNRRDDPNVNLEERNVYQSLKLSHDTKPIKLSHFIRLEERFLEQQSTVNGIPTELDDDRFSIRFRYRFSGSLPIHSFDDNTSISLDAYNEFMFNLTNQFRPEGFDQNWIYIGPTVKINDRLTFKSGFHDIYQQIGDDFVGNTIWDSSLTIKLSK